MKTSGSGIAVLLLVAMLAVQAAVQLVRGDIACPDVINDLSPCLPFLQGNAPAPLPTSQCCAGVSAIYAASDTKAARQSTCRCLKAAYAQAHVQLPPAQELPADCNLPLRYTITPDIDCDKIE